MRPPPFRPAVQLRDLSVKLLSFALLAGLATLPSSAQEFFPLNQVRPGLHGIGRTVFQGNRIEEFQVEILGVLENLTPRHTIILGRLSGGPLADMGVLQGMSGSPIYIDGKLLGAVALGFPFSKQPLAGITPIEEMLADANFSSPANRIGPIAANPQSGPWASVAGVAGVPPSCRIRRHITCGGVSSPSPSAAAATAIT